MSLGLKLLFETQLTQLFSPIRKKKKKKVHKSTKRPINIKSKDQAHHQPSKPVNVQNYGIRNSTWHNHCDPAQKARICRAASQTGIASFGFCQFTNPRFGVFEPKIKLQKPQLRTWIIFSLICVCLGHVWLNNSDSHCSLFHIRPKKPNKITKSSIKFIFPESF